MFDNIKNILNKFEKALNDLKIGFNDDDEGVRGIKVQKILSTTLICI